MLSRGVLCSECILLYIDFSCWCSDWGHSWNTTVSDWEIFSVISCIVCYETHHSGVVGKRPNHVCDVVGGAMNRVKWVGMRMKHCGVQVLSLVGSSSLPSGACCWGNHRSKGKVVQSNQGCGVLGQPVRKDHVKGWAEVDKNKQPVGVGMLKMSQSKVQC